MNNTPDHRRTSHSVNQPVRSTKQTGFNSQQAGSYTHIQLQRLIGNRATMQFFKNSLNVPSAPKANITSNPEETVQRMPTRQQVEREIGGPKKDGLLGKKNSTRYKPVLEQLDNLNAYMETTLADTPDGMSEQMQHVLGLYKNVEVAAKEYIDDKKKGSKVRYMKAKLVPMLINERVGVVQTIARYKRKPPLVPPKWWIITSSVAYNSIDLDDSMATGDTAKGGINSVAFFENAYKEEGVFKETKNVIHNEKELPGNASAEEKKSAKTEYDTASVAMLDTRDARLAERNVAMSRLDKLLDGGVIARTEFALHQTGGGQLKKGTFMTKAKGKGAGALGNTGKIAKDAQTKAGEAPDVINVDDPNLQRCLSRLQLIDTLAMQVDRHAGNFFIEYDESGKVLNVTGIDNDMAFGSGTDITKRKSEYPGLTRYVDNELAQRIIALQDFELTAIMEDLLSPVEIDALMERLHQLQAHLQHEQTRLLSPEEWNEATSMGMLQESNVYYTEKQKKADPTLKNFDSYHGVFSSQVK